MSKSVSRTAPAVTGCAAASPVVITGLGPVIPLV